VQVRPDDDGPVLRAVVIMTEGTSKGTSRSGQEYVDPLLILSGDEYAAVSFGDLHERICDALRGSRPRCIAEFWTADEGSRLLFEDGSSQDTRPG